MPGTSKLARCRNTLLALATIVALLLLSGCASLPADKRPKAYAEFGLEWQIDGMSDWYLQPEREWMGDSPYLTGRFGLEFKNRSRCRKSRNW